MSTTHLYIREEQTADIPAISDVTKAAFANMAISRQTEHFIILALRAANALALSLVAELDGRVVGHIAFSPVEMSDGSPGWYGLGPISVHPDYQCKGVGKALMQEGLSRLRLLGATGCCLVGHPEYYRKFGFENTKELHYPNVPSEFFFVLSFDGAIPQGQVTFHESFKADS